MSEAPEVFKAPSPDSGPEVWAAYFKAREMQFRSSLEHLINSHSRENGSDTPDFILAEYLHDCLDAWDRAVKRREKWYGRANGDGAAILQSE